jgi:D-alanyl-D-alanine carboxypeptidase
MVSMTEIPIERSHPWLEYGYIAVSVILLCVLGYFFYVHTHTITSLEQKVSTLETERSELQTSLATASSTILDLQSELTESEEKRAELADELADEEDRNEAFENQIRSLTGTVGDLGTIAEFDEELLQKYSRVYFLNENYYPEELDKIDEEYLFEPEDDEYFHAKAMEHLEDLMNAAEDENIDLKITSAYRSFDEQSELKGQYLQTYGEGANTFSADQGYSEHQLGTAVDFTIPDVGALTESFANTEAYEWLLDNAHEYGFILSYPEGNEFYVFEPWHWRFVGRDLAEDLDRSGDTFYETDQRELDEYRLDFFD